MDSIDEKPATRNSSEIVIQLMGDTAIICSLSQRQASLTERVQTLSSIASDLRTTSLPGICDVVVSPDRITVIYDPLVIHCVDTFVASVKEAVTQQHSPLTAGSLYEVPVCYGNDTGTDFDTVCRHHGMSARNLIGLHTKPKYLVTAIGFVPGFPYLAGLPKKLETPRLSTPRRQVPAGSVGIGGSQTGVYPFPTPGGWHLIGQTDMKFFDQNSSSPALLQPGDHVRFHKTKHVNTLPDQSRATAHKCGTAKNISVLEPGLMTTVQDLGRSGFRSSGVPYSGAADRVSAILANSIVGNPHHAAVLEYTLLGPSLRFETDTVIAVAGTEHDPIPSLRPIRINRGDTIEIGHASRGCRGYLAVAGGICVPSVLNSSSTYLPAIFGGFGGRPLRAGDQLSIGNPLAAPTSFTWSIDKAIVPISSNPCTLRILPEASASNQRLSIPDTPLRVTAQSDRMGIRLRGTLPQAPPAMISRAVLPGTVQLPPDGNPIILLCDAQTIGGYPVLGHVISADLPRAAQLRPGDSVRFTEINLPEAHRLLREQYKLLTTVQEGIASHLGPAENTS